MSFYLRFIILVLLIVSNQLKGQSLNLKIIGENKLKTTIIDSLDYSKSFDNYKNLQLEVETMKQRLHRIGYIDTTVEHITKRNDTLFNVDLVLGQRVTQIQIHYPSTFNTDLLKYIKYTSGNKFFILKTAQLESVLKELNAKIAEDGDPFSTLQLANIKRVNPQMIAADLEINSNQKRRIDHIIVKGYENFPKSYIKRFLNLKTGKSFKLNAINKKVSLLEDLRFASKIKDPEVLFTQDSTTLYLYIEKTRTNNFDGYLGFGTNENTSKVEFDGYLDLRLVNNLNYGESLNLYYKSDEIDQQTFRINSKMPYLLGSPIGLEVGLQIFRKDTTFSNASQYAKLNYQINAHHSLGIGISTTNSANLLDNDTFTLNDYTTNLYTLNYNYILPQLYDKLFPVNFWFDLSSGFGQRTNNLGSINQNVFNIETYKIFNLNTKNSFYTRVNAALLTSDNYLDNELFRFGGINSIRGFEENSLVANLYGVINTEYRYRLNTSIYVHSVLDAAYFENQVTNDKEKLFGFGFGFGLLTNAGLFRLNYSSGKSENRPFRFSDSKVHLSLTATF